METVEPGSTVATLDEPTSGTGSGSSRLLQLVVIDAAATSVKRTKAVALVHAGSFGRLAIGWTNADMEHLDMGAGRRTVFGQAAGHVRQH